MIHPHVFCFKFSILIVTHSPHPQHCFCSSFSFIRLQAATVSPLYILLFVHSLLTQCLDIFRGLCDFVLNRTYFFRSTLSLEISNAYHQGSSSCCSLCSTATEVSWRKENLWVWCFPRATSSFLLPTSKALVTSSDALVPSSFLLLLVRHLLLVAMPFVPSSFLLLLVRHLLLEAMHLFLVASCYY